jgi:phosphoglycolate phosphatase
MTIKAILFDKDGTLLDFDATFAPATVKVLADLAVGDESRTAQMAKAVDFDLPSGTIIPGSVLVAGSLENIAECLLPHTAHTDLAACLEQVDALYVTYSLESLAAFPFLESALDELAAMGLTLGVATNDSEEGAHAHLGQMGIAERFGFIAGFDSGFGEKPQPGMVTAFVDYLGAEARNVVMVGDSPHDLKAGRAAGAISVGVTSGGATAEELAPLADHVVEDISHLADLVRGLNASRA